MARKVLVPVDLAHDDSWERVMPEALAEARLRQAELHLVAVVPDYGSALVADQFPAGYEQQMLEKAMERLVAMKDERIPRDIPSEAHIGHGHAAEQILAFADRLDVDLIVLASHKHDMLRSLFIGSITDKIVHNANQSVLVVRG